MIAVRSGGHLRGLKSAGGVRLMRRQAFISGLKASGDKGCRFPAD